MLLNMDLLWMRHKRTVIDLGNKCSVLDCNFRLVKKKPGGKNFDS